MRIAFLFLLISNLAFGQLKCCFFNSDSLHIQNLSGHILRDSAGVGRHARARIMPPLGYNFSWTLSQMHFDPSGNGAPIYTLLTTGSTILVNYQLPSFLSMGMDSSNCYELRVTGTRSGNASDGLPYPPLDRRYPAEFVAYPQLPVSYDVTINLTTDSQSTINTAVSGSWGTTYAGGRTFNITGNGTGKLINAFYLRGDPKHPILLHFADGSSLVNNGFLLELGPNEYIVVDAGNTSGGQGLTLTHSGGSTNEVVFVKPSDGSHIGKGYWISGIHADGQNGGTGIVVQSSTGTFNGTNSSCKGILIHDNYIENTGNEGLYLGGCCINTPSYFLLTHLYIFRNRMNHTGNESWQIGNSKFAEVFMNMGTDAGVVNTNGQNYGFQHNSNCQYVYVYRNWEATTKELYESVSGDRSRTVEMFANFLKTTKSDGTNSTFWHYSNNVEVSSSLRNDGYNTIVKVTDIVAKIYNDASPTSSYFLNMEGNVYISNTATDHSYNNAYSSTNTILNNKAYSSSGAAGVVDATNNNYQPATLASNLYSFTVNSTAEAAAVHPAYLHDYYGYKRSSGRPIAGAFSNFPLQQH